MLVTAMGNYTLERPFSKQRPALGVRNSCRWSLICDGATPIHGQIGKAIAGSAQDDLQAARQSQRGKGRTHEAFEARGDDAGRDRRVLRRIGQAAPQAPLGRLEAASGP